LRLHLEHYLQQRGSIQRQSERCMHACIWACKKWNFYLYTRKLTLVTDYRALKMLLTSGGTGHRPLRLHRWNDSLQQYNFEVLYRPGKQNFAADCLSRYNEAEETSTNEADPVETPDDSVEIDIVFGSASSPIVAFNRNEPRRASGAGQAVRHRWLARQESRSSRVAAILRSSRGAVNVCRWLCVPRYWSSHTGDAACTDVGVSSRGTSRDRQDEAVLS